VRFLRLLRKQMRDGQEVRVKWFFVIFFIILHILCIPAFFYFSLWSLIAFFATCWACGAWGITLGYHRLLTHASFQTYRPIKYALTLLGVLSWQGGPATWVGTHRLHHAESDQPGDPHSPNDGFAWSHIFWIIYSARPHHAPRNFAKDLMRDPVIRWIEYLWWTPQLAVLAGLGFIGYLIGGWHEAAAWFFWPGILRIVLIYHATWFVNSAAHTWGYRNFDTADGSKNNWWVALISFGEGWHNNHHHQQRSAAHGMKWYEIDLTYYTILLMERLGLAWKVVRPQI